MQIADIPSHSSIASQALDLISELEKERAQLDKDLIQRLIPPGEAQRIRQSINDIISDLHSMLGASREVSKATTVG
jgi:methyl-accepting chemotaxis protein